MSSKKAKAPVPVTAASVEETSIETTPVVTEEKLSYVELGNGIVDRDGKIHTVKEHAVGVFKLKDVIKDNLSFLHSFNQAKSWLTQNVGFRPFKGDDSTPLEETELYQINVDDKTTVFMDEDSVVKFDKNKPHDFYWYGDEDKNTGPVVLIVIGSHIDLGEVLHSTHNNGYSLLYNLTGRINTLKSSVVLSDNQGRRSEIDCGSIINSEVTFNGYRFKVTSLDNVTIANSFVDMEGYVSDAAIKDSHISLNKYSAISNADIYRSHIMCDAFNVGRRSKPGAYVPRLSVHNLHLYFNGDSFDIRRGFEYDTIGGGYNYQSLSFIPLQRNADTTEFMLYAPKLEDRDYATPTAKITWDMDKSELRKIVKSLIDPRSKSDDSPLAGIGTIQSSIVEEAVSVLYNRLRIIKQTRFAEEL
ncbi:hypothetical protein FDJ25_gp160 [Vibrio phage Aphrodite1]|uniref:Uncharacterized protein n=1 Tax=Vibrio phage Aphrodite1 TaxID=2070057 RepID=A0A2I7QHU4_9CAUD|nr:hypothetical protein FDJ25_gp160 [Vibrio phage Aphrodite1]AUR80965.1 hypothetical protein Aphrodite1_0041 [Vibrio phage Aphrodite1]